MANDKITVRSALGKKADDGYPLAIYERHEDHPNGELYIADNKVHSVAPTAAVMRALREGRLVETEGAEGEEFEPEFSPDKTVEIRDEDTAETLESRYKKAELQALADAHDVEYDDSATKSELAEAIIKQVGSK